MRACLTIVFAALFSTAASLCAVVCVAAADGPLQGEGVGATTPPPCHGESAPSPAGSLPHCGTSDVQACRCGEAPQFIQPSGDVPNPAQTVLANTLVEIPAGQAVMPPALARPQCEPVSGRQRLTLHSILRI